MSYTDYDCQAKHFANLPDYSIHCGTDYLALKEIPALIKQHKPVSKLLDLGCGSGLATRFLKKHFPEVTIIGADINKSMLEQAQRIDPKGLYVHVPRHDQQIFYPFLPNYFDVITCSFVVHENRTLNELQEFLNNAAMMLRPGGLLLAWDVAQELFQGKWLTIETLFPLARQVEEGESYKVKLLPAGAEVMGTYWSPKTISTLLHACGLQSVRVDYPLVEKCGEVNWRDETHSAPYFVVQARKVELASQ